MSVDFLAVGSGAAGMTGALWAHDLGAETLVIEKASVYGGSTSLSGGVVWVPNNPLMARHGIHDSPEEAELYLETLTAGSSSREQLRAYLENAPRMMTTLAEKSRVQFECVTSYPDYFPEAPGGKPGGRSCEPAVFDARQLGDEFKTMGLQPNEKQVVGGRVTIRVTDGHMLLEGGWPAMRFMMRELLRYYTNVRARRQGRRNTQLSIGGALAGRLRLSLLDRKVPLWLDTPIRELLTEDGRVVGALVERDGKPVRIQARKGVLLAAGGFEHNSPMRQRYQQGPISDRWTAGCESNTGDTIDLGTAIGASLALMDDSWWCPTMLAPSPAHSPVRIMIVEKNFAGGIIVNAQGKRFMNEAAPYNEVVKSMYLANQRGGTAIPAHLIFDATYRRRYPCGPMMPGQATPDRMLPKNLEGNFFVKNQTLEGLARNIGVDAAGLIDTVTQFNDYAATGHDPDFHRGDSLHDRFYAARATGPNPNLGAIEQPPFYAVRVFPGDLGTKGGFRTDARARVLTAANTAIPGLYAAGNCSASVMGNTYPGAGATIGPAMTFAFLAAEDAAGA